MTDYRTMQQQYEFNVYSKREPVLVRGSGSRVWDDEGNEYIDCVAGHGVASLGHCPEPVIRAVSDQMSRFVTCSNVFYNDRRAELMKKLVEITPPGLVRVFLCNSGTEATEGAIKFARYSTGKKEIICAMRGFHGRSMGALSATYNPKYKDDFRPLVPGFHHVPFNNFEKLAEKANDKTAAVLLEVIQGEGGVNIGEEGYFRETAEFCKKRGILLVLDEVQTGFCRTGKMFACQHFGLEPDMLLLAKAMAGGVPTGAVVCADSVKVPLGKHGTTFGGNPLACAASLAAIEAMEILRLDEEAREKGDYFVKKLEQLVLPRIRSVRHMGLMIGIELKEKSRPYLEALVPEGVLALPAGPTVIRLLPPLIIEYHELDFVLEKLAKVLS